MPSRPVTPLRRRQPFIGTVPGRTLLLLAAQTTALIVRPPFPEARRGRVLIAPVPHSTAPRPAKAPVFLRPPPPEPPRGRVLITPPRRETVPRPAKSAVVIQPPPPETRRGRVLFVRPLPPTFRLTAAQTRVLVARRDERGFAGRALLSPVRRPPPPAPRPLPSLQPVRRQLFPYRGAALAVAPPRVRVIGRTPPGLTVRRDERGFRGRVLILPHGAVVSTALLDGNPRAAVTLRIRPVATLVLNAG